MCNPQDPMTTCINWKGFVSHTEYGQMSLLGFTYEKNCARFEEKCEEKDEKTHCVNWKGPLDVGGYGQFSFCGKNRRAHNVAWILANKKDIPDGMSTRHLCRIKNKACVNPEHLTIGTPQQNAQDEIDGQHIAKGVNHPAATLSQEVAQLIINSYDITIF